MAKMKVQEISGGGRGTHYLGKNAGAGADDPVVKVMAEGQHIRHQAPDCVEVLMLPYLLKFSYREIVCSLYPGFHSNLLLFRDFLSHGQM